MTWSVPWATSGWYGRIGGEELAAREDLADGRRHVMLVRAGAEIDVPGGVGRVLIREALQPRGRFHLRQGRRKVQAGETDCSGTAVKGPRC